MSELVTNNNEMSLTTVLDDLQTKSGQLEALCGSLLGDEGFATMNPQMQHQLLTLAFDLSATVRERAHSLTRDRG